MDTEKWKSVLVPKEIYEEIKHASKTELLVAAVSTLAR